MTTFFTQSNLLKKEEWVRAAQKMGVKLLETRYSAGQTPIEVRKFLGHLDISGLWYGFMGTRSKLKSIKYRLAHFLETKNEMF